MPKAVTTESFIERANEIHNYRYNYSKTLYISAREKIMIICDLHSEFEQTPNHHLRGYGCPECGIIKCANSRRHTLEEIIGMCISIHGNRYDYSRLTEHKNISEPVPIICEKHDEFLQSMSNHIYKKSGCPKCAIEETAEKNRKKNFIEEAQEIHGDKYSYEFVKYHNNHTKVTLVCSNPQHGKFLITPHKHIIEKQGCKLCSYEKISAEKTISNEEYIERVKKVHGDKYSYEFTKYTGLMNKISIKCPIHGMFQQYAKAHLNASHCAKCAMRYTPSADEFIERSIEVHGQLFDYSKIRESYTKLSDSVIIGCPIHSFFYQKAGDHIRGYGCKNCTHKTEKMMFKWLKNNMGYEPQTQFSFDDCRNSMTDHKYQFDFRIGNIFIELDGRQHFREITHWKSEVSEVRRRDIEKTIYLLENGYSLIRIDQIYVWRCINNWDIKLEECIFDILESNLDFPEVYYIGDKYDKHIEDLDNEYYVES